MHGARVRAGIVAGVVLTWVVSLPPSAAHGQTAEESARAADAVRSVWSTLDSAWNQRDAERFSDLFTPHASFAFMDRGQSFETREAIHRRFAEQFPQIGPDVSHHTMLHDIRLIGPDIQAVDGTVEILRTATEPNTEPAVLRTFAIFAVMLQTEQRWRIHLLRAYQLPATTGS